MHLSLRFCPCRRTQFCQRGGGRPEILSTLIWYNSYSYNPQSCVILEVTMVRCSHLVSSFLCFFSPFGAGNIFLAVLSLKDIVCAVKKHIYIKFNNDKSNKETGIPCIMLFWVSLPLGQVWIEWRKPQKVSCPGAAGHLWDNWLNQCLPFFLYGWILPCR